MNRSIASPFASSFASPFSIRVSSLAACAVTASLALPAHADVFTTNFPVSELHASVGANTTGSLFASAAMSAQGCGGVAPPTGWYTRLQTWCKQQTDLLGGSLWPSDCSPTGMIEASATLFGLGWATTWDTDQSRMLSSTLAKLQYYGTAIMVPIYGQADHWVAITDMTAVSSNGAWTIQQIKAYDGGPIGQTDSGLSEYNTGQQVWGGRTWANVYYMVLNAINPACDPNCSQDPYWHQYLLSHAWGDITHPSAIAASPAVAPTTAAPSLITTTPAMPRIAGLAQAPGIVAAGQGAMTAQLAQRGAFRALTAAGIADDPKIWPALRGGVAGPAREVNAVWPSGERWDYYLVPILSATGQALAFVQLAADDGAFEGMQLLDRPVAFAPISAAHAEALARAALAPGESLTAGILTWDGRGSARVHQSPFSPYYEHGVVTAAGSAGTVRIPLAGGTAVRNR